MQQLSNSGTEKLPVAFAKQKANKINCLLLYPFN